MCGGGRSTRRRPSHRGIARLKNNAHICELRARIEVGPRARVRSLLLHTRIIAITRLQRARDRASDARELRALRVPANTAKTEHS